MCVCVCVCVCVYVCLSVCAVSMSVVFVVYVSISGYKLVYMHTIRLFCSNTHHQKKKK